MSEIIEKLIKEGIIKKGSDESFKYGRIPFGIPALDNLTNGGIPKKRITEIFGNFSVGKSYLASQIVANSQKQEGKAIWIDTELSWDAIWMKRCGVNTDSIDVIQPTTGEEAFEVAREYLRSGTDVIVLDSIAGLTPTVVHDEDFGYNPMAWQARFVNQSLPKLVPYLKNGSAFILVNQVRQSLGPSTIPPLPGGMAQEFFSHFMLELRRIGWIEEGIKDNKKRVGFDIQIILRKSKAGGQPFGSVTIPFKLAGGLDILESIIRTGIEQKLILQAGAWYKVNDEKIMGLNGLRQYFSEHKEQLEKLKKKLYEVQY